MRKLIIVAILTALAASACGGGGDATSTVTSVDSSVSTSTSTGSTTPTSVVASSTTTIAEVVWPDDVIAEEVEGTTLDDVEIDCDGDLVDLAIPGPIGWDIREPDLGGRQGILIPIHFPDSCVPEAEVFVGHEGTQATQLVIVAFTSGLLEGASSAIPIDMDGSEIYVAAGNAPVIPVVAKKDRSLTIAFQHGDLVGIVNSKGVPFSELMFYVGQLQTSE